MTASHSASDLAGKVVLMLSPGYMIWLSWLMEARMESKTNPSRIRLGFSSEPGGVGQTAGLAGLWAGAGSRDAGSWRPRRGVSWRASHRWRTAWRSGSRIDKANCFLSLTGFSMPDSESLLARDQEPGASSVLPNRSSPFRGR